MATTETATTPQATESNGAAPVAAPIPAPVTPPAPAASTPAAPAAKPDAGPSGTPDAKVDEKKDAKPEEKQESLLKSAFEKKDEKDGTKDGKQPEGAPAEIAVKVPEGAQVDPEILDGLKALASKRGLTSEVAQEILELGLKSTDAIAARLEQELEAAKVQFNRQLRQEWGAQYDANLQLALKAARKFGDPGLLSDLNGLENAPSVMRTFAAIGRAMSDDSIALKGNSVPPPHPNAVSTGDRTVDAMANDPNFYPSMHKA